MTGTFRLPAVALLVLPWIAQWSLAAQPASPVSDLLNAPAYERTLTNHLESGEANRKGKPSNLLLRLDWFSSPQVVQFCSVTTTGRVGWGLQSLRSVKLGDRKQLEASELDSLRQAIARLPEPASRPDPERWLLVSGIRSNEWFTSVYDRRDIPPEVERLFAITGAPIVWEVPKVQSSAKSVAPPGRWIHTGRWRAAANAPLAVSTTPGQIQLWNLRGPRAEWRPDMTVFEGGGWGSLAVAVSTDGRRIAAVREQEIRMTESAPNRICWKIGLSEQDMVVPLDLAFVATNRLLAVQFLKSVEIWDAATGNHQSVLTSMVGSNSRMRASRDGRLLAVAIDNGDSAPAHIEIHDFAQSGSVQRITDSNAAQAIGDLEFSPDNRYLAVAGSLYRHGFAIWDWAVGTKRVVPARADSHGFTGAMQFAWSPDGSSLAVKYHAYEGPCVYDTRSWKPKVQWQFAEPTSFQLAFAWDGTLLALLGSGELHTLNAAALGAPTESSP